MGVYEFTSWKSSLDSDVRKNHKKCVEWMSRRPPRSYNYFKGITHQITFETSNFESMLEVARSIAFYDDGLEGFARGSN